MYIYVYIFIYIYIYIYDASALSSCNEGGVVFFFLGLAVLPFLLRIRCFLFFQIDEGYV